jgi:Spy/CpxP family protein refolding chaperone
MLSKLLRARSTALLLGFAVIAGLMVASVGTVHAVGTQDEAELQELQEKKEAEQRARAERGEWRQILEKRLAAAKELAGQAHWRGSREAIRALAEAGRIGQEGRLYRSPRVELRSGGWFGSGTADRALAMAEELELTEQQQDSIRSARRDYRRAEIERDAQIEVLDLDLDELMEDRHSADLNAVEDLMMQRASLRVQGEMARMRLGRQVWDTLTPEQQDEFQESRGNIFMLRGDRPSMLFRRDGSADAWEHDIEGILEGLSFGEMDFGDMKFELHSEDGEPFIWRYHLDRDHDDDDGDGDDDGEEKSTAGTAIGI